MNKDVQSENPRVAETSTALVLDGEMEWSSPETLKEYLAAIFSDKDFRVQLFDLILESKVQFKNVSELISFLHSIFKEAVHWKADALDPKLLKHATDLAEYEEMVAKTATTYAPTTKPNPKAVFWPDVTKDPSQSIFDCQPIVKNHSWVNLQTPIASAGSCFASEIAYNLQRRGFNYLVEENFYRLDEGVFADDYDLEKKIAGASANWGILFNTASFRQLAEAAFGEIQLPPMLLKAKYKEASYYTFPFRENVYFKTPEAFEIDQPKHLVAVRNVLTKAKVFVITPGLNECWQFMSNKFYLSRNPRNLGIAALVKHRVLSLEENIQNLQRFIDLVRSHNKDIKFIISVSPVPLMATGLAHEAHVVQANGHSKAVLRVAVEEICRKNKDVVYFPSYEIVTSCSKDAFEADARHVTRPTVERIMKVFDSMFVCQN